MTVKDIVEKVNKMITCKNEEESEWLYENEITPALCEDYGVTTAYIKQISRVQMIELAAGMTEVVKHFNKIELAELIIEKFSSLIGDDCDEVDHETINSLKDFVL